MRRPAKRGVRWGWEWEENGETVWIADSHAGGGEAMSDSARIQTREEWRVESIGGGINGTRAEVERWVAEWRNEYGNRYEIFVDRRIVTETEWEPAPSSEAGKR